MSLDDAQDAHAVLDAFDDAELRAYEEARRKRE